MVNINSYFFTTFNEQIASQAAEAARSDEGCHIELKGCLGQRLHSTCPFVLYGSSSSP